MQIIYGDAFHVPGGAVAIQRDRIRAAVRAIRSRPLYADTPIVHIPENAPGNAGPQIAEYLLDFDDIHTMAEWNAKENTLGVPATDRNAQTEWLTNLLATGGVFFSEDMQCYPKLTLEEYKDGLCKQALCWERVPEVSKDPTKPVKWHWSAKNKAGNDDRIVTLLMMWWSVVFYSKPRYTDFIRRSILPRRMHKSGNAVEEELRGTMGMPRAHVGFDDSTTTLEVSPLRAFAKMGVFHQADAMASKRSLSAIAAGQGDPYAPPGKRHASGISVGQMH